MTYDGAGKLRESRSRSNDGAETSRLYHYDDSGRLIRVVNIDRNGQQHDFAIYNYDATGRKTAQRFLPIERNTAMSFSAGIGESDGTAETVWYDLKHQFLRRVIYTRDADGNVLKEEVRLDDNSFFGELENASTEQR
jgi:YD repeat-containing protein